MRNHLVRFEIIDVTHTFASLYFHVLLVKPNSSYDPIMQALKMAAGLAFKAKCNNASTRPTANTEMLLKK